jgi:hypothetical protein
MKGATGLLIFLVIISIFGPCAIGSAEVAGVPHEDPDEAQNTLDSLSFLTGYVDIFTLIANGQYANASQLSQQLSYISVPADLSYLINRYNNLTQQLIEKLNDIDITLNNASRLLDQYRLSEARDALDHAGVVVAEAQILLGDIKDATATVSQKIGVFSAAAGNKIQQAYAQLQSLLDKMQELIDRYHSLLQQINQRHNEEEIKNIKATSITLSLNATECFVGGYLSASGALTSDGQALANRAVVLTLDGYDISTVNTGLDGSYNAVIQIPYKYVSSVAIQAYYAPTGSDRGTYLGSTSPTVTVKVLYYSTILNVSTPSVAYPGLSLTLNGVVTSQNDVPLDGRQVKVLLDGIVIAQDTTNVNGTFNTRSAINASAKLGNHTLTVTVAPRGLFSGTTVTRSLTITKLATTLEVSNPAFIMLPAQLQVKGTVKATSGPLGNADITIVFADVSATAKTESDGTFNITIGVPFSTVLVGDQTLRVVTQPTQPWQAVASKTVSVFVLNVVSIGLMLAAFLAVVLVLYVRFAKGKNKKTTIPTSQDTTIVTAPHKDVAVTVPTVIAERKLEGFRGRVIETYIEAISIVQSVTGVSASLTMTLREYLQSASPKLHDAIGVFSELTLLAEFVLYSTQPISESDSKKAEELAKEIRMILNGIA